MTYECPKHGPYGPARFCCACTRERGDDALRRLYDKALESEDSPLRGYVLAVTSRALPRTK